MSKKKKGRFQLGSALDRICKGSAQGVTVTGALKDAWALGSEEGHVSNEGQFRRHSIKLILDWYQASTVIPFLLPSVPKVLSSG